MAQKGKIRELQEDLRINKQVVKGLSEYCEKYKKRIKELEESVKNLTMPHVSNSVVCKIKMLPENCYYRDITNECKGCRNNTNNHC